MLTLKRLSGKQGQALVEYVVLVSLIAIGAMAALQFFGLSLQALYNTFPAMF